MGKCDLALEVSMFPILRHLLNPRIAKNAAHVALVVGSILNFINQGETIWSGQEVRWGNFLLNYVVPYCVSTYSAAKNELSRESEPEK